jgi:hypothetical protein
MIRDYWESFREWLAFSIYPEFSFYNKVSKVMGELNENERIVELIEQSAFKNKKAIIDLIETKYTPLNDVIERLDDASEDRKS